MLRFDETTRILWIAADSVDEARDLYANQQHIFGETPRLRGIVIQGTNRVLRMISKPAELHRFLIPPPVHAGLGLLIEHAMESSTPVRIEVAIYNKISGCMGFAWRESGALTLWKTETKPGESEGVAALRLLGTLIPNLAPEALVHLWDTEIDGERTHFFITYVEHDYDIIDCIWIKPNALSSFRLDSAMVTAFANSPPFAQLIRRGPA